MSAKNAPNRGIFGRRYAGQKLKFGYNSKANYRGVVPPPPFAKGGINGRTAVPYVYMYFVYLLQSDLDQTFYISFTNDLNNRLKIHNTGRVYYTKRKIPWKLCYYETYTNKEQAIERKKQLKNLDQVIMD